MIDRSVEGVVVALCADYGRRAEAIRNHSVSHRTEMEFRYYNFKIYDAAAEVVGAREAEMYLKDVGERIGYASSELADTCSERSYKSRKIEVKKNIALKLHFMD